jgi:hypothetical protein
MSRLQLFSSRFSTALRINILLFVMIIAGQASAQQDVRKVFTTYNGFWSSSADTISTVKPDDSHMLLGFSYKNNIYSTGVSDTALSNRSIAFTATSFRSFQLATNAIQTSTATKIGVGTKYGGYGNVAPIPVSNDLTEYLVDGKQGLDLGTAVFNIPGSQMRYKVTSIFASRIADGIPDVLVTQVGAPPAAAVRDTFRFEDSLGNVIGSAISISMANISIIGTGNWKFYTPGTPCTYEAGLQGDRPLRMMAFELSDFGLTAANIGKVSRFVHRVSGESDQAFVAYNNTAFTAERGTVLPVKLESFNARKSGEQARLDWKVSEAKQFGHFEIERSNGSATFETIGSVYPETGATNGSYSFNDAAPAKGGNYYRLKMVDLDGSFGYSPVQNLSFDAAVSISAYPNPASTSLYIQHQSAAATISLTTIAGNTVPVSISAEGSRSRIDVSGIPAGFYILRVQEGTNTQALRILINH